MARGAMTMFVAIKAQVGDAVKGFSQVRDSVDELQNGFNNLREQAAKVGAGLTALGGALGGAIMRLGDLGGQVDTVRHTFDRLTQSIQEDSNTMLSSLRGATGGMMNDFELMKSANLLMSMGLADSTESAHDLMEMAVQLGGAMGGTPTESIENFALMLANQSIPRLDSFGISSGRVRELMNGMGADAEGAGGDVGKLTSQLEEAQIKLARAQKAAEGVDFSTFAGQGKQLAVQQAQELVDELTASLQSAGGAAGGMSREQAFLNAVMEEGTKSMARLGDPVENAQTALAQLSTTWENTVHRFAQAFAPVAQGIAQALNGVLSLIEQIPDGVFDIIAKLTGVAAAGATAGGGIMMLLGGLGGFKSIIGNVVPALDGLLGALGMSTELFGGLGLAIKAAVPIMFAVVAAVKILQKAWANNWGNIQGKVAALVSWLDVFKEKANEVIAPWIERLKQLAAIIQNQIWSRVQALVEAFLGMSGAGGQAFHSLTQALNNFIKPFQDGLQVIFRLVERLGLALSAVMRGDFKQAARYATDVLLDLSAFFVAWVQGLIKNAATWGRNLLVSFASGIVNAVNAVLTPIMNKVGEYIALFWRAQSPPKQGVLRHIAEWGAGVMGTYLKSFEDADFGILDEVMSPVQTALQDAVSLGNIDESQVAGIFNTVKEQMAGVLAEFRETGQVNQEMMGNIAQTLGDGGAEYTKLVSLSVEHEAALQDVERAQNALNDAQEMGYVPAAVKAKLKSAQAEADSKKKQLDWQEKYLDALRQESGAAAQAAGGAGAGTGAGATGALETPELGAADLSEVGAAKIGIPATIEAVDFDEPSLDLQLGAAQEAIEPLKIPPMSKPFQDARAAVQEFISTVRSLSPNELVDRFAAWAQEMTGIDVPAYVDRIRAAWQRLRDFFAPALQGLREGAQAFIDKIKEVGLSSETMDALSRATENLKAAWAKLREVLFPVIAKLIELVGGGILAAIRARIDALAASLPGLGQALGGIIQIAAGLVEAFTDLITKGEISTTALQTIWTGFKEFFGGLLNAILSEVIAFGVSLFSAITGKEMDVQAETERILGLIRAAWETLTAPIGTVIEWIGKFLTKANEIGVPTGLPLVRAAINALINPVQTVIDAVSAFTSKLQGITVPESLESIVNWVQSIGDAFNNFSVESLTSKLTGIQIPQWLQGHSPPPLAEWIGFVGKAADEVSLENMQSQLTQAMNLQTAVEQGTAQFAELKLNIVTIWDETVTAVIGFAQMLLTQLDTWVKSLVTNISTEFTALEALVIKSWQNIGKTIDDEMAAAARDVKNYLQQIAREFDSRMAGIADTVERRMNDAKTALQGALNDMKTIMEQGAQALSNVFNENFTVANISETISLAFTGAEETLREVINSLGSEFADALTALFQPAVDAARQTGVPLAVDLPFEWTPLAKGAILSRPLFLAGEAGTEIVAPIEKMNAMIREQMAAVLRSSQLRPAVSTAVNAGVTHNHLHSWENLHVYVDDGDPQTIVTEMNRLARQASMRGAVPGALGF